MKKSRVGVSGTVSALLTILLLVSGFAVSTGLLSAIYSAQSEVLRKAVNVGEAVSERLQAFVYEDVRTNRTLLTVRNVGSVGSEVEYLMAVGYDGSVLAEVRPGDTLKLGTQQSFTLFLSDLLGPGFDNYTEVRSRMATLYLKTVKGGVFGSGYMAPPSVMTAAYATSTTTVSTIETSLETFMVPSYETTITSWTATVIINNPDHWPVDTYVGVAFMRDNPTRVVEYYCSGSGCNWWYRFDGWTTPGMRGFPEWGLQPGLTAKDRNDVERSVSLNDMLLPKYVAVAATTYKVTAYPGWMCGHAPDGYCYGSAYPAGRMVWSGGPGFVVRFSRLGPTYIDAPGGERFEPRMMIPRLLLSTVTYYSTYTTSRYEQYRVCYQHLGRTYCYDRWGWRQYVITTATGSSPVYRDIRDNQYATFPGEISVTSTMSGSRGTFTYRVNYKLSYIKVVDMWNTTNVIAYVTGNSTVQIRADRPLGIAAVYVYSGTTVRAPPPPPDDGRGGPGKRVYGPAICFDQSAMGKDIRYILELREVPEGSPPPDSYEVTFYMPPGSNCQGYVVPGSGTYDSTQLAPCPRNGDTVTCTVPHGQIATAGCPPG
jgi:hypothetical protein